MVIDNEDENKCICPNICDAKTHKCICSMKKEWGEHNAPEICIAIRHICICWEVIKKNDNSHIPINQNRCRVTSSSLHKYQK